MPNQNAIVAMVVRIAPAVEKQNAAEILREHPEGIAIEFEGNQTARLYPGDHAAGILEILDELRRMRAPVYVEVHPDNKGIMRLLIPLKSKVTNIAESATEEIKVELERSHARHLLSRKNRDFGELLETLRVAKEKNAWLVVTETDKHEIIDARPWPQEPTKPEPILQEPSGFLSLFRRWFHRLFKCLCCVSPKTAQQMLDLVSARTCDPLTVPIPCIPFLYPDDGCWARAHEMCRLMITAGVMPKKVWIDGNLHVNTKNNPSCEVFWGWHVAPTICVRQSFFHGEDMVIDPSLFMTPVSKATWKGVQGDANATLVDTAASLYWRNVTPTDPNYVDTNYWLQYYRLQLKNRSLQSAGPPPYAYCP